MAFRVKDLMVDVLSARGKNPTQPKPLPTQCPAPTCIPPEQPCPAPSVTAQQAGAAAECASNLELLRRELRSALGRAPA